MRSTPDFDMKTRTNPTSPGALRTRLAWLGSLAACLAVLLAPPQARADDTPSVTIPEHLLDSEVLSAFKRVAVLDGGRVKPMDSLARFRLLRLSGRTSMKLQVNGERARRVSASEWMLWTMMAPDAMAHVPIFNVNDTDAVVEIGIRPDRKRQRFSFEQVAPHRDQLMEKWNEYQQIDSDARTRLQNEIVALGFNYLDYELTAYHFDFSRTFIEEGEPGFPEDFVPADLGREATAADIGAGLGAFLQSAMERGLMPPPPHLLQALQQVRLMAIRSANIKPLPPASNLEEELWHSPSDLLMDALSGELMDAADAEFLLAWAEVGRASGDGAALTAALVAFNEKQAVKLEMRNEGRHLDREVRFYENSYFGRSLALFVFGFVLFAFTWAAPQAKWSTWLARIAGAVVVLGLLLVSFGIYQRCVIRERAPVTTLYETILFITACMVAVALFIEFVRRNRIAASLAAFVGALGMFMANRYEAKEGVDTMPQLQAVLDTNFWLYTHVTTVVIGYAAGLLAMAIAWVYLLGRLFRRVKAGDSNARFLTSASYGVIAFCLLFSLVGTVLGGIWANDSWGRFWGWDPKENGALMIVLWALIILHARLGGYVRELGIHGSSIVMGAIVAFSWWGTNQLGVGLHAYGFTDGVWGWLSFFWLTQLGFLLIAMGLWVFDDNKKIGRNTSHPHPGQKLEPAEGRM